MEKVLISTRARQLLAKLASTLSRITRTLLFVIFAASAAFAQANQPIIPGKSIGNVYLGMTTKDLFAVMGQPGASLTATDGKSASHLLHGLMVRTDLPNQTVSAIAMESRGPYSLVNGLTVGSAENELQAKMVHPGWTKANALGGQNYCYEEGLLIGTAKGRIYSIKVWPPGCDGRSP
jgi:hypothetical protein